MQGWEPIYAQGGKITQEEAQRVAEDLKVDLSEIPIDSLLEGMRVELEHGSIAGPMNVTNDELHVTALFALAHLKKNKFYYWYLDQMEKYVDTYGRRNPQSIPGKVFLSEGQ